MKLNYLTKPLLTLSIASTALFITPGYAESLLAEKCALGSTCTVPGNDGGSTYFNITPQNGMKYKCNLKGENGSLKVWIHGGENYTISEGYGYFNVHDNATVTIEGHFKHPTDMTEVGQIKFRKLMGKGTVSCTATS